MKTKTQAEQYADKIKGITSNINFSEFKESQLEQDWNEGTTTIIFSDNSKLKVCDLDIEVLKNN